jgi:lipopolysaccharide export system protein LptC
MATANVPVTITNGPNSTRADSMTADLDTQTVRLRHNVESIYVKPTP